MEGLKDDTTYLSNLEIITSTWFLAVSLGLTADSFSRAIVERTIAPKYWLLFPVNISILVNEILMIYLVRASSICSIDPKNSNLDCNYTAKVSFSKCSDDLSVYLYYGILSVTRVFYFIIKPSMLYLAYRRAVKYLPTFLKPLFVWTSFFLIAVRIIEVSVTTIFFFIDGFKCRGSYCDYLCWITYSKVYYARDAVAPIFRIYYIIAECIFYWALFKETLKSRKDKRIRRAIFHQAILFTIDIAQLLTIMVYRELGRFIYQLPSNIFAELFSTAFTIFVMTKFLDKFPELFKANSNIVIGNLGVDNGNLNHQPQTNIDEGELSNQPRTNIDEGELNRQPQVNVEISSEHD
ncbi:hypothetical protein F8M41_009592 [Gigaspora margarita]|uniref:Uncharacterized protein n=1 Tax=Gigaspora margarita TaxID=4874 RepID=A0A8H4EQK3_GIGMA|nr:hypothetical protein F8M41_009592 [Gigaspora margarita]